jgi:ATP-dependent RNA helicase RhlB
LKLFIDFLKRLFKKPLAPAPPTVPETQPSPEDADQPRRSHVPAAGPADPPKKETEKTGAAGIDPGPKKPASRTVPRPAPDPVWSPDRFQVPPREGKTRFHDLDLPEPLMHAIADLGFEYCTDIQAALLPHTLTGKDATAKAQTGTGKTAAFIISLIQTFTNRPAKNPPGVPRALILAPTRELVHQIEKDFQGLARYSGFTIVSVFGGTGYARQQQMLQNHPVDVIAATPGRLLDFIRQKIIDLSRVEIVVIDEADRMLDMGFIPDVRRLVYMTPHKNKRQTLFFSATLTDEVLRLADSWTTENRVRIEIDPEQTAADSIRQIVYLTTEAKKFQHVYNLIVSEKVERVLIFVNRKDTATFLSSKLSRYGQQCKVLSGDVSQNNRFKVLENFKKDHIRILVATDVAARGLHVENISHVINYDMPFEPEHYIHRIGRTGRAGATGTSISFADEMSSFQIPQIESVLGHKLRCEYPSDILEKPLPKPSPAKETGTAPAKAKSRRRRRSRPPGKYNKKRNPTSG